MKRAGVVAVVVALGVATPGRAQQPVPVTIPGLGTISFPTSTRIPAAQQVFLRGVLSLGATYDRYILPEYDLIARRMQPWMGAVAIRSTANARTALWLKAIGETVSPARTAPTSYGPSGSRSAVNVSVGVTLREPAQRQQQESRT
jgi:hypothetical protein